MKVLVSDSSVLIEFSKRDLLDKDVRTGVPVRGAGPAVPRGTD